MKKDRITIVSPHPDDAVLGCGATIYQLASMGWSVRVVTVFTRIESRRVDASHRFATSDRIRLLEDEAALVALDATHLHLGFEDAVSRLDSRGTRRCTSLDAVISDVDMIRDGSIVKDIRTALEHLVVRDGGVVLTPMGESRHLDHQIVVRSTRGLTVAGHYDDFPYFAGTASRHIARSHLCSGRKRTQALQEQDLEAKVRAICEYRSQVEALFESKAMASVRTKAYARSVGGERLCIAEDGQPLG